MNIPQLLINLQNLVFKYASFYYADMNIQSLIRKRRREITATVYSLYERKKRTNSLRMNVVVYLGICERKKERKISSD